MTLRGIAKIGSVPDWEGTTLEFFEGVYRKERPGGFYDVMVGVMEANVTVIGAPTSAHGGIVRRGLSGGKGEGRWAWAMRSEDTAVVVTYVQETRYLADNPNWEPNEDFALFPLSTKLRRDEYVGRLKSFLGGYEYLTDVSDISIVAPTPSSNADAGSGGGEVSGGGGAGVGAVVWISVTGAAVLLAAIVAGFVCYKRG